MEENNAKMPKDTVLCCLICRRRMAIKGQTNWEEVTTAFFEFFVKFSKDDKAYSCCNLCKREGKNISVKVLWDLVETLADKLEEERKKNGGNGGGKKNG